MSRNQALLVDPGADLIGAVRDVLLSEGEGLAQSLVVFPGRRPAHFLRNSLASRLQSAFQSPRILSMDEWVDMACGELGYFHRPLSAIDGVGLLYRLHRQSRSAGAGDLAGSKAAKLDDFLPWGFKIFSDFEELRIEQVSAEGLRRVEVLAEERIPPRMQAHLSDLAGLYQDFYQQLSQDGLSTRSSRYGRVAEERERLDLSSFRHIILAGFFGLTRSEVQIFSFLLAHEQTLILLQEGGEDSGIEEVIEGLKLHPRRWPGEGTGSKPKLHFYRATDSHGQVMKLNQLIRRSPGFDLRQVIVLPAPETLFPVAEQTLPWAGDDYNISMGYPLLRTPLFTLLQTLGKTLETRDEDLYFLPDYLRLILHPYIKNLFFEDAGPGHDFSTRASYPTRILFHTLEEALGLRQLRFMQLREIEEELRKSIEQEDGKMAGEALEQVSPKEAVQHLRKIHERVLEPFEQLKDIGDFCQKLLGLVSYIALESPVQLHPYSSRFIEALMESLSEMMASEIRQESLGDIRGHFRLLENYIQTVRAPFPGTPLKGLQVLGFLETRNLKFETVYFLDANEGIIPSVRKDESLLPMGVRQELGLSTYREREKMARYYFENLIAGAREAHIFYSQGQGQEKSRLVEGLIWQEQKQSKHVKIQSQNEIYLHTRFTQTDPEAVQKTGGVRERLLDFEFTATKLDTYLRCPLRFYYRFLLGLKEKEGWGEEVEPYEIGKLIHKILAKFFETKRDQPLEISSQDFEVIAGLADQILEETYGERPGGGLFLVQHQVQFRLKEVLRYHRKHLTGSVIQACERTYSALKDVPKLGPVPIAGIMDRVDRQGDQIIIWDYKTGSGTLRVKPSDRFLESAREDWYDTLRSVQLPFYLMLYLEHHPDLKIEQMNAALMMLGEKSTKEDHLFSGEAERMPQYEKYRQAIYTLIGEIMDPDGDFCPTLRPEKECGSCMYKVLCGRQWVVRRR